jgi:hypothetical protein
MANCVGTMRRAARETTLCARRAATAAGSCLARPFERAYSKMEDHQSAPFEAPSKESTGGDGHAVPHPVYRIVRVRRAGVVARKPSRDSQTLATIKNAPEHVYEFAGAVTEGRATSRGGTTDQQRADASKATEARAARKAMMNVKRGVDPKKRRKVVDSRERDTVSRSARRTGAASACQTVRIGQITRRRNPKL